MEIPSTALDNALYTALSTDGTLIALQSTRVYKGIADQDATYPYTVMKRVSAVPDYTLGDTVWFRVLYQFDVYDNGTDGADWRDTNAITDRLNALLTRGTLTITGFTLRGCLLELSMDTHEVHEGVAYPMSRSQFALYVN